MLHTQPLSFTAHAQTRCQQRAIRPEIVERILDYGRSTRLRGADSYALDKEGRRRLRRDLGDRDFRTIERQLDAYVVVADDGRIITAAWSTQRLWRH